MSDLFVKFWGVRGSIPTPGYRTQKYGGNTACLEIRLADALFVCDAGTGIRELGLDIMSRGEGARPVHLFISHTHWDHIQGFPFFVPAYLKQSTIRLMVPPLNANRLFELLSGQMKSDYFPVRFCDLAGRISPVALQEAGDQVEGVSVSTIALNHPGGATGFSFACSGRKVVYASDSEIDEQLGNLQESLADGRAPRQAPEELVQFASGADLLVADGQYTDQEYPGKRGWGHSRATTLVDLAVRAGAKRLALCHHDPLQDDQAVEAKVDACCQRVELLGAELEVFGAREGVELKIG